MITVAIVYHSATGTTEKLAHAVANGARIDEDSAVIVRAIKGGDIIEGRFINENTLALVDQSDAVIFGAPTFMGGPSAQFKAFADASSDRWSAQLWQDKICAGFTVGSNLNGDQTSTLQYFSVLAAQHGMLWLGLNIVAGQGERSMNRLGVQLGASAQTLTKEVAEYDLLTAEYLGKRVAAKTLQVKRR